MKQYDYLHSYPSPLDQTSIDSFVNVHSRREANNIREMFNVIYLPLSSDAALLLKFIVAADDFHDDRIVVLISPMVVGGVIQYASRNCNAGHTLERIT